MALSRALKQAGLSRAQQGQGDVGFDTDDHSEAGGVSISFTGGSAEDVWRRLGESVFHALADGRGVKVRVPRKRERKSERERERECVCVCVSGVCVACGAVCT